MGTHKMLLPNTTQVPNVIFDWLMPLLEDGELRCLLYIIRRTYGFQKKSDQIAISQFVSGIQKSDGEVIDSGTGLSKPTVITSLKVLSEAIGIVKKRKYRNTFVYSINLEFSKDKEEVVKSLNQFRDTKRLNHLTKIGKTTLPKTVKPFNTQNQGNQGNQVIEKINKKERSSDLQVQDPEGGTEQPPIPPAPFTGTDLAKGVDHTSVRLVIAGKEYSSTVPKFASAWFADKKVLTEIVNEVAKAAGLTNKEQIWSEFMRFLSYWSEKSPNGKKELWQKRETFDPKKRLRTWFDNKATNFGKGEKQSRGVFVPGGERIKTENIR